VVFTDFQCPYCRGLTELLEDRLREYPRKFRIVFKYFPMNTLCNKHIERTLHSASCATARVAEVTRIVGGEDAFWKMHDALFADPSAFSTEWVKQKAGEIGVDNEEFWTLFKRTSSWEKIYQHVDQGAELGVQGTPAIFFDGRRMTTWGDDHTWKYLLGLVETDAFQQAGGTAPHATPATRPATRASESPATRPTTAPAATRPD
jgi:protein-disulfide isomerase